MNINIIKVVLNKKTILEDVSISFYKPEIIVLLGKNGSGKTTLLKTINNSIKVNEGEIIYKDKNINDYKVNELAKEISYLPQNLPLVNIDVKTLLTYGRYPYSSMGRKLKDKDKKIIEKSLDKINLTHLKDTPIDHLSGGERAKAYFGMVLCSNSNLVLLDEPFASLDINSKDEFSKLIVDLKNENKVVIVTVHDILLALDIADRIIILDEGRIISDESKVDFIKNKKYEDVFNIKLIKTSDEQGNFYYVCKKNDNISNKGK